MCTSPVRATVTEIAYRHGFYHPERFAKYYRQLFGEHPSVTLKRPGLSEGQELWRGSPGEPSNMPSANPSA